MSVDPFPTIDEQLPVHFELKGMLSGTQWSRRSGATAQRLPHPFARFGATHGRGIGNQILAIDQRFLIDHQVGVEAGHREVRHRVRGRRWCGMRDKYVHVCPYLFNYLFKPVMAIPRTNCFCRMVYKIMTGTTVSIEPAANSS